MVATSRRSKGRDLRTPDGGQMLLLAGFLIAATAIMTIGAFSLLERTETQVNVQENAGMLDLFLNTRSRATAYFHVVTGNDTASSVRHHLDGYLYSQYQTAHALSMELNATLAGATTASPKSEADFLADLDSDGVDEYADTSRAVDRSLWSNDGAECYGNMEDDGTDDGLITDANGDVIAAIFWLNVRATDASLEEYIIIDVPSTSGPGC